MPTNPMSIIVTYIKAYAIKNRHIELQQVNNTIEPLKRFDEKVKKLENQRNLLSGCLFPAFFLKIWVLPILDLWMDII